MYIYNIYINMKFASSNNLVYDIFLLFQVCL